MKLTVELLDRRIAMLRERRTNDKSLAKVKELEDQRKILVKMQNEQSKPKAK